MGRAGLLLFGAFSAAMLGLAAGAVWMVPTLYLQRPLPWLALPAGWLLGLAVRTWIRPPGPVTAAMAALATLLAGAYLQVLLAAARTAGALGIGLLQALREAGLPMLLDMLELALAPRDIAWLVGGIALAVLVAGRGALRHRAP